MLEPLNVVRWFVLTDGRSGIVYDEAGLPSDVDSRLFADVDAALEIAGSVGIQLNFVLLDHRCGLGRVAPRAPETGRLRGGAQRRSGRPKR